MGLRRPWPSGILAGSLGGASRASDPERALRSPPVAEASSESPKPLEMPSGFLNRHPAFSRYMPVAAGRGDARFEMELMKKSRPLKGRAPEPNFARPSEMSPEARKELIKKAKYKGSSQHKLHPKKYGLENSSRPRPTASLCDDKHRLFGVLTAQRLLRKGIENAMVSRPFKEGELPERVWSVQEPEGKSKGHANVYEARLDEDAYYGYPLNKEDDPRRKKVLAEWRKRTRND